MMSTPSRTWTVLGALCLTACTLITDATERKVVEGPRDLDFTFKSMSVHRQLPLDVAVVSTDGVLQGRARVLLPPDKMPYPDVTISLTKALPPGVNRLFFYIDNNANNLVDGSASAVDEHIWVEKVPSSGRGSFVHSFNFKSFTEDDYQSLNGSLILETPMLPVELPARRCLSKIFEAAVADRFEIKVFVDSDQDDRQVAYFKTYPGNPIPDEIRLPGVIETPSDYTIEVLIDGALRKSVNLSAALGEDLIAPAASWFPASLAEIAACRNAP